MKKILSLLLAVVMLFGCCAMFASCGGNEDYIALTPVAKEDIKFGLICLHDENSTYDKNFIDAAERMRVALGLSESQLVIKKNIPESDDCYDAAVELVEDGCQIVFANSFGHEDYIMKAAAEFPNVQFCHATGTKAHTSGLGNYHNAFASIYEGRFVAGIVAGIKLAEMYNSGSLANKLVNGKIRIGYVGAFPYAEVISGYTSWFLGVRAGFEMSTDDTAPEIEMNVEYTNSWYDEAKEKEKALALINAGAVLLSQHADSMGAPRACEEKGVPNVSYNGSTIKDCPNTFLVSSYIDWDPYYQLVVNSVINGVRIPEEYCGGFAEGSVKLTDMNTAKLPEGTAQTVEYVIAALKAGMGEVFDIDTFTVKGKKLETYKANVNDDAAFTPDTEVIVITDAEDKVGYFAESEYRCAPYFDVIIDGINVPAN